MAEKKYSYREAYEKLDKIRAEIESNLLDVDELAEKLKEASRLLKICRDKLYRAEEETRKIMEEIE